MSRPIVRIATAGITLGIMVMILSLAVVRGFQSEIRNKVIGFGSHIQITNFSTGSKFDDPKLEIKQDFYPALEKVEGVNHIQVYALKQGVIETEEEIQGVIVKGIGADFDWSFLNEHLVEGEKLIINDTARSNDVLISAFLAGRLQVKINEKISVYFPDGGKNMVQRRFTIKGIYNTGLEELDRQFIFIDIAQLQKINGWGLEAQMRFEGCENNRIKLKAFGFGGEGEHRFLWNTDSLRGAGSHEFCLNKDTLIYCIVSDRNETLPDTAFFKFTARDKLNQNCHCPAENEYSIYTSGGSYRYYTGGFEVTLNEYDDLIKMDDIIYDNIDFDLKTTTISQRSPEIFNWLEMLDINTIVLIILMIFVAVINMTSALLILILERTNMIGMLKALGSSNWNVRKIFLYQAAYLIGRGLIFGNILGITLGWLQQEFGFLKLDPSNYYVSTVPVLLEFTPIIILNIGTLLVCVLVLILPSYLVTKISPVKAIRFD